ncbi:hypothetical protein AB0E88_06050 [Streptomyces sp. NPDC028635]|uniref:hypothetical protein n=1 Tax=Streptomyces sp. NPDC028635 TaxID=3154800 RepID=UPI0033E683FC
MSNPDDVDPPTPHAGAVRLSEDGELLYWDGTEWTPYVRLTEGEAFHHGVVFRGDDAEQDDR